jgi:hypothetical protein
MAIASTRWLFEKAMTGSLRRPTIFVSPVPTHAHVILMLEELFRAEA